MSAKSKRTLAARGAVAAALAYFRQQGRDLPWRQDFDPYAVFVSEVMLQQTGVARVMPKFAAFMDVFPDWTSLSRGSFPEVLRLWSGLGYNRRAKNLLQAARIVVARWGGELPEDPALIASLPGVGPYTAAAIYAFAFNREALCMETNIRTVLIHHCFPRARSVSDARLLRLLRTVTPLHEPRVLYSALMDYGAHLKKSGIKLNHKSKGYVKQKPFRGSVREVRGRVLSALLARPLSAEKLACAAGGEAHLEGALTTLLREGMIRRKGKLYALA